MEEIFDNEALMRDLAWAYAQGWHTTDEYLDILQRLAEDAVARPERGVK